MPLKEGERLSIHDWRTCPLCNVKTWCWDCEAFFDDNHVCKKEANDDSHVAGDS